MCILVDSSSSSIVGEEGMTAANQTHNKSYQVHVPMTMRVGVWVTTYNGRSKQQ